MRWALCVNRHLVFGVRVFTRQPDPRTRQAIRGRVAKTQQQGRGGVFRHLCYPQIGVGC